MRIACISCALFVAVFLAACGPATQSPMATVTLTPAAPQETPSPFAYNTAFHTLIPTSTITPTWEPTSWTIPVRHDLSVIHMGVSNFPLGQPSQSYGAEVGSAFFWTLVAEPDRTSSLTFIAMVMMPGFVLSELTPTPASLPSDGLRLRIFRYHQGTAYTGQPAIEKELVMSLPASPRQQSIYDLSAELTLQELQARFGDCRAFTFQVLRANGAVLDEANFSISPDSLRFRYGFQPDPAGLTVGLPYSLQQKEAQFFRQGKFVVIHEPAGGFYALTYDFDISHPLGTTSVPEMVRRAEGFTITVFSYHEDGSYSPQDSARAGAELHASVGRMTLELPIDYMQSSAHHGGKYYLQLMDDQGKIIKEEYFEFIPYAP